MLLQLRKLTPAPIKPFFRQLRRTVYGLLHRNEFLQHRYLDQTLTISVVDSMSREWYDKDWDVSERGEFALFQILTLASNDLVFDIGAHQGIVAILLKKNVVPEGRVVAVEMDASNAAACRTNAALNSVEGIDVVHAAISDTDGEVVSSGGSNASIANAAGFLQAFQPKVRSVTISALCRDFGTPQLIYLDVEGAEGAALRGAGSALGEVTNWYIELHGDEISSSFGDTNHSVASLLIRAGYNLLASTTEAGPFEPVELESLSSDRCFLLAVRARDLRADP